MLTKWSRLADNQTLSVYQYLKDDCKQINSLFCFKWTEELQKNLLEVEIFARTQLSLAEE